MLLEAIRRYGFWSADALSGGDVRRSLLNLRTKVGKGVETPPGDLDHLLHHAVSTTVFYNKFRNFSSLADFPVVRKGVIKQHYDDFISSDFKNKRLHKTRTGGSSGERFEVLQDMRKRKKVLAEIIFFHDLCNFKLGCRYVYVRIWHTEKRKPKWVQIAENMVMYDCSYLDDRSLSGFYDLLRKDSSIKYLHGFANSLAAIASYFDRQGYTPDMFNIDAVVCGAERLEPDAKRLLRKIFGCPVVSRYSNNENGVLAQQPVDGDHFLLNDAHYFFETLRLDSDEPAAYGEPARLILTDLYNYAMPFIRYDTEDIVVMNRSGQKDGSNRFLSEISGRKGDIIYDTRGNKISPHFVTLTFRQMKQLSEFQFIQNGFGEFTVKLEDVRGSYTDDDIKRRVFDLVGKDALVNIERVQTIPRLSSGKFRRVISQYKGGSV